MTLHYSARRNAFFDSAVQAELPDDARAITAEQHQQLLAGQSRGEVITAGDDGSPTNRAPVETADQLRARLVAGTKREAARRIAAIAPLWHQLNDWRALAAATGDARAAIERRFAAIDAVRAASNRLEAELQTMTPRQLARVDLTDDSHWTEQTS
ncbi:hypothetical protein [Sphingomonas sp. BK069]|uniref:hypothetical protein n=1 Tax=Sphingomonas sp. BK069 TaxID=2586979 RepID=UPI001610B665|nr:hypothetical protein [Sphingomonas sp. BK069]MBB3346036.1 hypothetical protein [Sphingomonas sp. BK069]